MTIINICSGVRLDSRYQHTISFASQAEQKAYFAGKVVKTFPAYSHHRRSWELKVEAEIGTAQNWNYLYVDNPGVHTHYYFINKIEYVNDTTVKLTLELDVIQTNLFRMNLLPCFVERQHTETDVAGEHTVPEGLEVGTYYNYHQYDLEDLSEMGILVLSSLNLYGEVTQDTLGTYGRVFNGVYSGLGVYAFNDIAKLENQLKKLDEIGKPDAVVAIWMYPKNLLTLRRIGTGTDTTEVKWGEYDWENRHCAIVTGVEWKTTTLAKYTNYTGKMFPGYTPKNNKLYSYPYNLLYVTGNQGDKAEYRFEYFDTTEGVYLFRLYGAISPDAGVKIVPDLYNIYGAQANYDEGLTMGSYPPCAWDSDTYKVWLAQNQHQLNHSTDSAIGGALLGLGMIVGGAVTTAATGGLTAAAGVGAIGAGVSTMYNAYNQISGIMAQKEDTKAQPPQAKGVTSTTVNVASGKQTFSFYYKCVRPEQAKQLDDYFTMYGYRLNELRTPSINARPAFTFVKTIGCKVTGNMSNEDVMAIEKIFDAGVTFWKNGDKIGDYTQNNKV